MIKPKVRKKLPECDRCLLYANNPFLVCAVHPSGPSGNSCLDFRSACCVQEDPNAEPEELWEPEGATYYNGEEIIQPPQRWTREEQLWLLDNHPMFTGKCPQCGTTMNRDYTSRVHWDCECGWKDDSV